MADLRRGGAERCLLSTDSVPLRKALARGLVFVRDDGDGEDEPVVEPSSFMPRERSATGPLALHGGRVGSVGLMVLYLLADAVSPLVCSELDAAMGRLNEHDVAGTAMVHLKASGRVEPVGTRRPVCGRGRPAVLWQITAAGRAYVESRRRCGIQAGVPMHLQRRRYEGLLRPSLLTRQRRRERVREITRLLQPTLVPERETPRSLPWPG
jgi:hypothetical protein